jgi:putative transcription factor
LVFDNYKHQRSNKKGSGACQNLRCEVCGRKIYGKPFKVVIEGAKLTVCGGCSKHGKLTWEEEPKLKTVTKPKGPKPILTIPIKKTPTAPPATTVELVENFDAKIRQAREKLGLSHEDLGKKLNEKISLLRKIETKKMTPDNLLATKLEHALKIKLIVPAGEEKIKVPPSKMVKPISREITLGDLIQLGKKEKKGKEGSAERGRS